MNNILRVFIFTVLLSNAFVVLSANAAVINAASCSQADVQTAINAASNGDTINIPAGSATWTGRLTLNKAISIIGMGMDQTNVTGGGFTISDGTDNWRISGFTFIGNSSTQCLYIGGNHSTNGCRNFRIDHCKFNHYNTSNNILAMGQNAGVIDHNQFTGGDSTSYISLAGHHNTAWTEDTGLGTENFLFVEDNTFTNDGMFLMHVLTGGFGAKYVFRYNQIIETGPGNIGDWVDVHGYCHGSSERGGRAFEIYNNTFTRAKDGCCSAIYIRGGTGVVWGNTFNEAVGKHYRNASGGYAQIYLAEMRVPTNNTGQTACSSACSASAACPASAGGEGYPCCDQVGRGANNTLEPVYFWNNKNHLGEDATIGLDRAELVDYIQENRDYYKAQKLAYTPYTYPHPLVQIPTTTTVDTTQPSAPSNLKIIIQ